VKGSQHDDQELKDDGKLSGWILDKDTPAAATGEPSKQPSASPKALPQGSSSRL